MLVFQTNQPYKPSKGLWTFDFESAALVVGHHHQFNCMRQILMKEILIQ